MIKDELEKEKKEKVTLFSDYGYLQVSNEDLENSQKTQVNISNKNKNLTGSVQKSKLSKIIQIKLKTLYGDRKLHTFSVKIDEQISTLINLLIKEESTEQDEKKKWNKNKQYRIISTLGSIRELAPFKTFLEENIKNGQTLIIAVPLKLSFSETQRGHGIVIQNKTTALKQSGDELQYVICNKGYSSGTNYCEFILEAEPDERNILIGVTLARSDFYFSSECKGFWGYVLSECNKISYSGSSVINVEYGDICKMGDRVGVLMEFKEKGLDVSFYINDTYLGLAFKELPQDTYYPCAVLYYESAKVKITNRLCIPEIKKN